jgi:hypothetical protein
MRWTARLLGCKILWATLLPVSAATACGADLLGPPKPRPESTGRVHSERLVQRGVSRSIHGETTPLLLPDEPFELHWVTEGPGGLLAVSVWETPPINLGPTVILSFEVPTGCGAHNGVTVSSLPAGHKWELRLGYSADDRNPCPVTQSVVSRAEWLFDFSTLPTSPTTPGSITITRLMAP